MAWPAASARRVRLAVAYVHEADKPIRVKVGPEAVEWWAAAQANGYDLLVCDASGVTLAHQRSEWTLASKADIRITAPTYSSGDVRVVYLYVGAAAAVVTDPSVTVTGASVITGQVGLDTGLPALILTGAPPRITATGAEPGQVLQVVVGSATAVVCPVEVALAAVASQGGRELEDVAGVTVGVAVGTGASTPATPANWRSASSVRVIASPTRGIGVLAVVTPDEAADAVLRVTVYLLGPTSGSLPSRTLVNAAIVRGLAPLEV